MASLPWSVRLEDAEGRVLDEVHDTSARGEVGERVERLARRCEKEDLYLRFIGD
jgi:hypothetical protein